MFTVNTSSAFANEINEHTTVHELSKRPLDPSHRRLRRRSALYYSCVQKICDLVENRQSRPRLNFIVPNTQIYLICRRGDSNPHELPHTPLKRARLPVPPLRHVWVGHLLLTLRWLGGRHQDCRSRHCCGRSRRRLRCGCRRCHRSLLRKSRLKNRTRAGNEWQRETKREQHECSRRSNRHFSQDTLRSPRAKRRARN